MPPSLLPVASVLTCCCSLIFIQLSLSSLRSHHLWSRLSHVPLMMPTFLPCFLFLLKKREASEANIFFSSRPQVERPKASQIITQSTNGKFFPIFRLLCLLSSRVLLFGYWGQSDRGQKTRMYLLYAFLFPVRTV